MPEIFFIADTHFGHKAIIGFEKIKPFRPFATIEEHDAELIRRWNAVVRPKDTVWHLGDFCFGPHNVAVAGQLNGIKRLVLGNHDLYGSAEYLKYFSRLCGILEFKNEAILSHAPVHPMELTRWPLNIHGHLHARRVRIDIGTPDERDDRRYFCVSAEQIGLKPISYGEIMEATKVS